MDLKMPYFDIIFEGLRQRDPEVEAVFHRHVHFGLWLEPDQLSEDPQDCALAMDRMCQLLLERADVRENQDILDVGCGFGGTLATINEQLCPVRLTGLNIDERQVEVCRSRVQARAGNSLEFVVGDACQMPFADRSFDRVLAVECIFHFPDRKVFFREASRVLRPGGCLTMTDFVLPEGSPPGLFDCDDEVLWGTNTNIDLQSYRELGAEFGMELTHYQDISGNVWPTYPLVARLLGRYSEAAAEIASCSHLTLGAGGVAYSTLRFDLKG